MLRAGLLSANGTCSATTGAKRRPQNANIKEKVKIFRYVTEGTFDSYSWQLIENKQKFIGQIMTSKFPVRNGEDVDEAALTYAEVKALATGNSYIKEKMDLDIQVSKLKLMKVGDKSYTDKKEAGTALVEMCKEMKTAGVPAAVGEYAGFKMSVSFDTFNHAFESMPKQLSEAQTKLETVERQLETAKVEVTKLFAQEAEFAEKLEQARRIMKNQKGKKKRYRNKKFIKILLQNQMLNRTM